VAKLIAHEVQISLTAQSYSQKSYHLMQSDSSVNYY
jgi:hypothetical protein